MPYKHLLISLFFCFAGYTLSAQHLALGDSLRAVSAYDEAISSYRQFIEVHSGRLYDCAMAWLGIAQCQQAQGNFQEALSSLQQADELRQKLQLEDKTDIALLKGAAYLRLGDMEAALQVLKEAKASPTAEPYQFALIDKQLGAVFFTMGNFDEAATHYQSALDGILIDAGELQSEVAECLYWLASILEYQQAYTAAKANLFRAVRIEEQRQGKKPFLGPSLLKLGIITLEEKQYAAARNYLQYALTLIHHPADQIIAHIALSKVALGMLEILEAEKQILSALDQLYPNGQIANPELTDFPQLALEAHFQYARVLSLSLHIPNGLNKMAQAYDRAWTLFEYAPVQDTTALVDESFDLTMAVNPDMVLSWIQQLTGSAPTNGVHYFITPKAVYGVFRQPSKTIGFMADANQISGSISALLTAIQHDDAAVFIHHSEALFRDLCAPFWSLLDTDVSINIHPHGFLTYLPFEVLLTDLALKPDFHRLPYLIKSHVVRYPNRPHPLQLFDNEQTALLKATTDQYRSKFADQALAWRQARLDMIKKKKTAFPRLWSGIIIP
jgi:tetratricopeptide (TPR) repeat protein